MAVCRNEEQRVENREQRQISFSNNEIPLIFQTKGVGKK